MQRRPIDPTPEQHPPCCSLHHLLTCPLEVWGIRAAITPAWGMLMSGPGIKKMIILAHCMFVGVSKVRQPAEATLLFLSVVQWGTAKL